MPENIPEKMQAAALDRFGGPEVIEVKTLPVPECGEDEILIRVESAGVGAWDHWERQGEMAEMIEGGPKFPYIPGSDGAGVVVATGKKVERFAEGDRVYAYAFGNRKGGFYAEYAAIPAKHAAKVPAGITVQEAGALAADGVTGLLGLEKHLGVAPGDTLLIFGANGGIGHIAIQLAKRLGAKVLAIASGKDGVELAQRLGADRVVEGHSVEDVERACGEFAPEGIDKALVLACSESCDVAMKRIKRGGRIAYPNGVDPRPKSPEGVDATAYDGVPSQEALERLNELISQGPFHLEIGHLYAMEEAAKAQEDVLKHHLGKLALRILPS